MRIFALILVIAVTAALPVFAGEDFTRYELLAPGTHQFDIIYDASTAREGAAYYFNPIRASAVATKERVIDLATGKEL